MAAGEPTHLEAHASGSGRIYQAGRDLHLYQRDGTHETRRVDGESVVDECPYPGLSPFDQAAARWFHGRETLVAQLLERLDHRLDTGGPLLVVGPSGAGKSSLLQAGLLPALARGALPGSREWPVVLCTPTESPVTMLDERLPAPDGRRLVVVVDQLEELFVQCRNPLQRHEFLNRLAELAGRALVVYGLRADFYPMCADLPPLRAAIEDGQLLVGPLSATELRETILFPARDVGLDVEPGLVDLLLADLADGAADYPSGRLPLLAHALRATWRAKHGHVLTVEGYRTTGGIRNAVATTAERVYATLPASHRKAARTVFLKLVRIGEGTDDVSRRQTRAELLDQRADPTVATAVIDAFTAGRMLIADRDIVRITHDALLHAWPRLRGWIDTDKDINLRRQRLTEDATTWARNANDPANLYRGSRLDSVRTLPRDDLGPTAAAFLATSVHHQRVTSLRRRTFQILLAVLVLFSAGVAALAVNEHETTVADAADAAYDRLTSSAGLLTSLNASAAARLDVEAHGMRPGDDNIESALINTENTPLYTSLNESAMLDPVADPPSFSWNGRVLATERSDGATADLWRVGGPGRPTLARRVSAGFVVLDPAAPIMATIDDDGNAIRLWNIGDPNAPAPIGAPFAMSTDSGLMSLAFSRNGRRLATDGTDGVSVWDLSRPAHPWHLPVLVPESRQADFALSPDGNWLAIGTNSGNSQLWYLPASKPFPLTPPTAAAESARTVPLSFSQTGGLLAVEVQTDTESTSTVDQIQLWRVSDNGPPTPLGLTVAGVAATFGPGDQSLAVVDQTDTVRLWNIEHTDAAQPIGQPILPPLPPQQSDIGDVVLSPDGNTLVTANGDGGLLMWHLPHSTLLTGGPVGELALSPDGATLVEGRNFRVGTRLWRLNDPLRPATLQNLPEPETGDTTVVFSPARPVLATLNENYTVDLWNLTRPDRPIRRATTIDGAPMSISANGDIMFVETDGPDEFWTIGTLSAPTPIWQHIAAADAVFSPGSPWLATVSPDGQTSQLWNIADPAHPIPDGQVPGAAMSLSPDGRTLEAESADGQTFALWNTTDPARPRPLILPTSPLSYAFGPHHLLATGSQTGSVQLWNLTDPAQPTAIGQPFTTDGSSVDSLAFSANGQVLVAGADSGQIYVWDLRVPDAVRRICADTQPLPDAPGACPQ